MIYIVDTKRNSVTSDQTGKVYWMTHVTENVPDSHMLKQTFSFNINHTDSVKEMKPKGSKEKAYILAHECPLYDMCL